MAQGHHFAGRSIEDINASPTPTWVDLYATVKVPNKAKFLFAPTNTGFDVLTAYWIGYQATYPAVTNPPPGKDQTVLAQAGVAEDLTPSNTAGSFARQISLFVEYYPDGPVYCNTVVNPGDVIDISVNYTDQYNFTATLINENTSGVCKMNVTLSAASIAEYCSSVVPVGIPNSCNNGGEAEFFYEDKGNVTANPQNPSIQTPPETPNFDVIAFSSPSATWYNIKAYPDDSECIFATDPECPLYLRQYNMSDTTTTQTLSLVPIWNSNINEMTIPYKANGGPATGFNTN